MKNFLRKMTVTGLAVLSLTTVGLASGEQNLYIDLNSNPESVVEITEYYNQNSNEDSKVYITSEDSLVDSLTGGVLIAERNGKHFYNNYYNEENEGSDSIIIGGPDAVESNENLKEENLTYIYGETRYETATAIAKELGSQRDIIICSGVNFVDALPATSLATVEDRNILLVGDGFIPDATREYLDEYGQDKDIIVIGGSKHITEEMLREIEEITGQNEIERISGANRYDTSLVIADRFDLAESIVVSEGEVNEKTFSASILAAKANSPLILVDESSEVDLESLLRDETSSIYFVANNYISINNNIEDNFIVKDFNNNITSLDTLEAEALALEESLSPVEDLPETVEETLVEEPIEEEVVVEEVVEEEVVEEEAVQETGYSQTGAEAAAKEWIAQRESGGSYTAYNPRGGYYGRYQLNPSLIHYGASPAEQEAAADAYVYGRYGSWVAAQSFWMANGWY